MASTIVRPESKTTSIVPVRGIGAQIDEAAEGMVGSSAQGASQTTSAQSDPVTDFKQWLEMATQQELEAAEPKLEEIALSCHRSGRDWRLSMGEHLYKHREVVKKRKSRDWTKWVTETLDMGRTTAYDLMRDWTQEYGHTIAIHDEPNQPNPKAEEIADAVVKARENRKGRGRALAAPELDGHVKVPWPEMFVTRDERDLFKEARERNEEGVYRICRAAFYVVIGEPDPESEPGVEVGVVSALAQTEGEEAPNDPASN